MVQIPMWGEIRGAFQEQHLKAQHYAHHPLFIPPYSPPIAVIPPLSPTEKPISWLSP